MLTKKIPKRIIWTWIRDSSRIQRSGVICMTTILSLILAITNASAAQEDDAIWRRAPRPRYVASVEEACGYDRILDGSQTYTVFAPTNLALSEAEARQLIAEYRQQEALGVRSNENTVVRRFLQNHIALYRHPVSSLTDKTIKMMNDKYAALTPEGLLMSKLSTKNVLCDNGLLFTISGKLDYVPNVLE